MPSSDLTDDGSESTNLLSALAACGDLCVARLEALEDEDERHIEAHRERAAVVRQAGFVLEDSEASSRKEWELRERIEAAGGFEAAPPELREEWVSAADHVAALGATRRVELLLELAERIAALAGTPSSTDVAERARIAAQEAREQSDLRHRLAGLKAELALIRENAKWIQILANVRGIDPDALVEALEEAVEETEAEIKRREGLHHRRAVMRALVRAFRDVPKRLYRPVDLRAQLYLDGELRRQLPRQSGRTPRRTVGRASAASRDGPSRADEGDEGRLLEKLPRDLLARRPVSNGRSGDRPRQVSRRLSRQSSAPFAQPARHLARGSMPTSLTSSFAGSRRSASA